MNIKKLWYLKSNDVYLPQPNSKWGDKFIRKNIMLLRMNYSNSLEYECVKPSVLHKGFNELEVYDGSRVILNSDYIIKVEWADLMEMEYVLDTGECKNLNVIVPERNGINKINMYKCLNTYAIRLN